MRRSGRLHRGSLSGLSPILRAICSGGVRAGIRIVSRDRNRVGLSSENRQFITGIIFVLLLIAGPVPIGTHGVLVRIGYLTAIPTFVWAMLRLATNLKIDDRLNEQINRGLTAAIAGALMLTSYQTYTAKFHLECTRTVPDGDGGECVGDYVRVPGGHKGESLMWAVFGVLAFAHALARRPDSAD